MTESTVYLSGGKWPLLARKVFPFSIRPKQSGDEGQLWVFRDWGVSHALLYMLIGFAGIGMWVTVYMLAYQGWGGRGVQSALLFVTSAAFALYGVVQTFLVYKVVVDLACGEVHMSDSLLGVLVYRKQSLDGGVCIQYSEGVVSLTPKGKVRSNVFAVFLAARDNSFVTRKMVGCFKAEIDAIKYATHLAEKLSLGPESVARGGGFAGRISK